MLAGSLTEFSLPDVFTLLAATRKAGVLNLTSAQGSANGRVWVLGGTIAFAVADVSRSPLASRLLHGGEIDPDDAEALVRAQAAGDGIGMAAALAEVGVASDRARVLLHDQVVDATFDLTRWPAGEFSFDPQPAPDSAEQIPTFVAAEVMAAVDARRAEWEGIVATLPSPAAALRMVSRPPTLGGTVSIDPEQWEVLTLVDGVRTVAEVIRLTGQGQFTVAKLLSALVADGLVTLTDQSGTRSTTHQRADQLARLEHEILGAPLPASVTPSASSPSASGPSTTSPSRTSADPASGFGVASHDETDDQTGDQTGDEADDRGVDMDMLLSGGSPAAGTADPGADLRSQKEGDRSGIDLDDLLSGSSAPPARGTEDGPSHARSENTPYVVALDEADPEDASTGDRHQDGADQDGADQDGADQDGADQDGADQDADQDAADLNAAGDGADHDEAHADTVHGDVDVDEGSGSPVDHRLLNRLIDGVRGV